MTKTTEIYKNLLQAASKWPSDKQRTLTVSKHITNRIKSSFESSSTPDLPFAQKELIALNALLNNELQQKVIQQPTFFYLRVVFSTVHKKIHQCYNTYHPRKCIAYWIRKHGRSWIRSRGLLIC